MMKSMCVKRKEKVKVQTSKIPDPPKERSFPNKRRQEHLYPVNAKVNAWGERSPREGKGKKGPKKALHSTSHEITYY